MDKTLRKAIRLYGSTHPIVQALLKGRGPDKRPRKRRSTGSRVEVKPHPKDVADVSPEQADKIRQRFDDARRQAPSEGTGTPERPAKPKKDSHKLLASSPSLDEAKKVIGEFWHSKNISLKDNKDGTYDVYNAKGKVDGARVRSHKGRYRFEMEKSD